MNYLKAEHLKFKRTISNKLLFIAPFLTALFAWIIGGFYGFQYMTFYWWYAFLLPGTIAILCSLAHQKEERAGKYYSVLSVPISLKRFEYAKALILIEKLLVAAVFLAVITAVSNLISPALAVYSVGRNFAGSIALIIASIWQIPLCLLLVRKTGLFLPIALQSTLCWVFSCLSCSEIQLLHGDVPTAGLRKRRSCLWELKAMEPLPVSLFFHGAFCCR